MSNFTKISQDGVDLFMRTDRRTDGHDKSNSRFSQFCECA